MSHGMRVLQNEQIFSNCSGIITFRYCQAYYKIFIYKSNFLVFSENIKLL